MTDLTHYAGAGMTIIPNVHEIMPESLTYSRTQLKTPASTLKPGQNVTQQGYTIDSRRRYFQHWLNILLSVYRDANRRKQIPTKTRTSVMLNHGL